MAEPIIGGQKTIAKNTIYLYFRLLVTVVVSLYTSRIVLDKLGVENYGIYNIVGSIIVSFAFISNALMSAYQRFFSYHIGKGTGCKDVFSMSLNIQVALGIAVVVLLETFGLWLFSNTLDIPESRTDAALVVYQISILTFVFNFIRIPFNSLIIAKEKMSAFAVFSVVEVFLKLVIVYALVVFDVDKLILYAWLMCGVVLVVSLCYFIYSAIYFEDCRYNFKWDKSLFKDMLSFSGWNFVGGLSSALSHEGPNYFMNIYLGVTVNAAMGIAKQVSSVVFNFSSSFQSAFNPQIVKSYASGDMKYLNSLIFRTSKISFFLMYIIALPIICSNDIFDLWLTVVPDYTRSFCICIMLSQLINCVSSPLWMTAHAIGNIRVYQIVLTAINISICPLSWLFLYCGFEPYYVLIAQAFLSLFVLIYRVKYLKDKIDFDYKQYYFAVVLKSLVYVPLITIPFVMSISSYCHGMFGLVKLAVCSTLVLSFIFYFIGCDKDERQIINAYLRQCLSKLKTLIFVVR